MDDNVAARREKAASSTRLLTLGEVADSLKLSLSSTKTLAYQGRLATVKIGRSRRCTEQALSDFIASLAKESVTVGEMTRESPERSRLSRASRKR